MKIRRDVLAVGWILAALSGGASVRTYEWTHPRFVEVQLVDATDSHNELYFEREYLLLSNESPITNAAPAVFIEDSVTGEGFACLRLGPLPHARADKSPDYILTPGRRRLEYLTNAYPYVEKAYTGGRLGRIRALRAIQREIRPYDKDRDGLLLSNTWGDGNRDACVNEAFLMKEVEKGAELGVDVIQIDDGWQAGRTANSSAIRKRSQGRWGSYWDQPDFWDFDSVRFPNGVKPIVDAARAKGMKFGLWFGPDSSDEARLWRKDADFLLGLHRDFGIDYFKLDSMRSQTALALDRQRQLMSALMDESHRRITVDLDVTAGVRPGYFGFVDIGPVFVENRYVRKGESRLWWPHLTLRNLWSLAHAVDSVRLRMEFLNPERHPELYGDDPLAPCRYPADTLFAGVMAASPLGWFEIQNLSPATVAAWKSLVAVWKRERAAWYGGELYPVGACPDGFAWTGFVSAAKDGRSGYALLFRELSDDGSFALPLKGLLSSDATSCEVIAGRGQASIAGVRLQVEIPSRLDFVWVKIGSTKP